jgi:hypothetical protein
MTEVRDVMIVLLTHIMLRMEMNKTMTVGQATDLLIKLLDRQGYKIEKK